MCVACSALVFRSVSFAPALLSVAALVAYLVPVELFYHGCSSEASTRSPQLLNFEKRAEQQPDILCEKDETNGQMPLHHLSEDMEEMPHATCCLGYA
jgi:hypothetical protein